MAGQLDVDVPEPLGAGDRAALVVGHDRFSESDHAVVVAIDLARQLHAFLHVVHAVGLDDYPINPDAADWEQQAADVLEAQRRAVEDLLAGVALGWRYHTGRGGPVELLAAVAEAHDALMIVVGTRGGGLAAALARMLGRSVSRQVALRQSRPVLVVPSPPRRPQPVAASVPMAGQPS
jgi:nucleotide-binding universal stress UspA family protein